MAEKLAMIGFLKGIVHSVREDSCLLDVQGVGYLVLMSGKNLGSLKAGQNIFVYTHMIVREDAMFLCGFLQAREYDLFIKLITVSGIGAKGALAVLSSISVDAFILAVQTKDLKALTGIPGIGKKTAERLLLELQGKFAEVDTLVTTGEFVDINIGEGSAVKDVTLALQSLGYDAGRSLNIAKAVYVNGMKVQDCIKLCLKELSSR